MRLRSVVADNQDRDSVAWHRLVEAIEQAVSSSATVFDPRAEIGDAAWQTITVLPRAIGQLRAVRTLRLYGSSLTRIPPEIGQMESLEEFTPYTSYGLHWFPYEITRCRRLKDSTVSTRALYGNPKNQMPFPDLMGNPIQYFGEVTTCSVCGRPVTMYQQYWVQKRVATDVMPLLANVCSVACLDALGCAHKGGI